MKTTGSINWLEPIGGPLIVIEKEIATLWGGSLIKNGEDYTFACSHPDYTTVTKYKSNDIIILGDEPLRTGIKYKSKNLLFFIRWIYADEENQIEKLIEKLDFTKITPLSVQTISLNEAEYLLFDSVEPYDSNITSLSLNIIAGEYRIETYAIEKNNTMIILDKLMMI